MSRISPSDAIRHGLRAATALALLAATSACLPGQSSRQAQVDVESDLRAAAIEMEIHFTNHLEYPAGAETPIEDALDGDVTRRSADILLVWSTADAFCLEGAKGSATSWYASADGGITDSSCR